MITFFVLLITLLSLAIAAMLIITIGGAGIVLAFGDLIICGLIISLIIRLFKRRK